MIGSRLGLVVVVACLVVGLSPSVATAGGVDCAFDASSHIARVTVGGGGGYLVQIGRTGTDIVVAGSVCGSVTTVDTIDVDITGHGGQVIIDLHGGPFAPGYTDEGNGTSEIEIVIRNMENSLFTVSGSDGEDTITAGARLDFQTGIFLQNFNLNAGAEGSSPDEDISIHGTPTGIWIYTWGGNDRVSAAGTGTILSQPNGTGVLFRDGPGADSITGGSGPDEFGTEDAPDPGDSYAGGAGFDTLDMGDRYDAMSLTKNGVADDGSGCPGAGCEGDSIGDDAEAILAGNGNDTLVGGAGSDWLYGGGGVNTLRGLGGNDTFWGSFGTNTFFGGPGQDTASWELVFPSDPTRGVVLSIDGRRNDGFPGTDSLTNIRTDVENLEGTIAADRLTGSDGANRLLGGDGNDLLTGGDGNDVLVPGAGNDRLVGGVGTDTASFGNAPGSITADLLTGTTSGHGNDTMTGLEWLVGSAFADHLLGSNGRNRLEGAGGNDALYGFDGDDLLMGERGNDAMHGGPGQDSCVQGPGDGQMWACER